MADLPLQRQDLWATRVRSVKQKRLQSGRIVKADFKRTTFLVPTRERARHIKAC